MAAPLTCGRAANEASRYLLCLWLLRLAVRMDAGVRMPSTFRISVIYIFKDKKLKLLLKYSRVLFLESSLESFQVESDLSLKSIKMLLVRLESESLTRVPISGMRILKKFTKFCHKCNQSIKTTSFCVLLGISFEFEQLLLMMMSILCPNTLIAYSFFKLPCDNH